MLSDIKQTLLLDLTSTAATSVQDRNPNIWSDASLVPSYATTPLKDIWIGTSAASSEFARRIVYKTNSGGEDGRGDITLTWQPMESVIARGGDQSHEVGAETCFVDIVLTLSEQDENWNKLEQSELRIRYLLDYLWRSKRGVAPVIASTTDNTIDGYIRLQWLEYIDTPNSNQYGVRYIASYVRAVPR